MTNEKTDAQVLDWLTTRLTQDRGRDDWEKLLRSSYETMLDTPLQELFPKAAVRAYVDAHLEPTRLASLLRPAYGPILRRIVLEARKDTLPLRDWVPSAAEAVITGAVERPGLVRKEWVETIFREEAVEKVAAEALFRALKDFSAVFPKILKNLPLLRKLPVFGGGGIAGKLIEEVERLLEPEIRSFLATGTRRALDRASIFAVDHMDDPASRAMRKNVVGFILSKSPEFHVGPLSSELLLEVEKAAVLIAEHLAKHPRRLELLDRVLDDIEAGHGAKTLRTAIAELGAQDLAPPFAEISAVTWPMIARSVRAPETQAWLLTLIGELRAELQRPVP